MKKLFTLLGFLSSFLLIAQSTDFYISAHPDDWQLFMNPNAYKSVKTAGNKVVFIHTTAGDAGKGIGGNGYYLAREEGSLRAIRFMSNAENFGLGTDMNKTYVTINGHNILKFSYRNIVAYFLRLPDGNMAGDGFPLSGYPSLQKIYNGSLQNITAVDGSTTYTSLGDLKKTIGNIVNTESQADLISFNIADTNESINPNDHSDHLYSSKIIQDIALSFINKSVKLNLYVDYHSGNLSKNLSDNDYLIEVGTWGATTSGITDNNQNSTWEPEHNSWLGRQYFRTESQEENLALNKPTKSSSSEAGSPNSNANDGNNSSYWGASPYSQWWQVDLKANYNLSRLNIINYYDGIRYYQYEVLGSNDGINWTRIVDFMNNTTPANSLGNTFTLNNITARYLKINMKYNSANVGVHINEFKAYGVLSDSPALKSGNMNSAIIDKKVLAYPNPVKLGGILKLDIPLAETSDVNIKIYDLNSNELYNKTFLVQKNNIIDIPLQNLKKGVHIVNIGFAGIVQTTKIIIE